MNGKQRAGQVAFTIVELLIVIVVIAILAGITIVAYNGIQTQARSSSAKSELNNAKKQIENLRILSANESYSVNVFGTGELKINKSIYRTGSTINNLLYCRSLDGKEFAYAVLTLDNIAFYVSNATGVAPYTSTWTHSGTSMCPTLLINNTTAGSFDWGWGYTNTAWQI